MPTNVGPQDPRHRDASTHIPGMDELAARRWRVAVVLTTAMVLVYFGFILLVAFAPQWLGTLVVDGLSRGIVLGACVIVAAWVLTFMYVRWANRVYDPALAALRTQRAAREA